MDYLEQLSIQLGGRIHSQQLANWNYDVKSRKELTIRNYKGRKIEFNDLESRCEVSIRVESNFAFSINMPDKLFGFTTPSIINGFPYPIYFSKNNDENPSEAESFKSFWEPFFNKLKELELAEYEGVFYYRNAINLVLACERNLIAILDFVMSIVDENPLIFAKNNKERIYSKRIPENLRPLIPLLKKWCIPDDSEREQLLEETSEKQKSKLLHTVRPYMVEINTFLDSFKDEPLSHEAILLGNLAELISEISIENP